MMLSSWGLYRRWFVRLLLALVSIVVVLPIGLLQSNEFIEIFTVTQHPPIEYSKEDITILTQQIIREFPEFTDGNINDWQKVNILRRWAYRHIDRASKSCQIDRDEFRSNTKNVLEIFKSFDQDEGGCYCGVGAYTLMKLYQVFGFDAYVLSIGKEDIFVHAVTIVKVNYGNESVFAVQDVHFNVTYVDQTGKPFDYFEMLTTLKNYGHTQVKILPGDPSDKKDFILCSEDKIDNMMFYGEPLGESVCEEISDEKTKCEVQPSLETFIEYSPAISPIYEFLVREGYPPEYIYWFLYLRKIYDGGAGNAEVLQVLAESIIANPFK